MNKRIRDQDLPVCDLADLRTIGSALNGIQGMACVINAEQRDAGGEDAKYNDHTTGCLVEAIRTLSAYARSDLERLLGRYGEDPYPLPGEVDHDED